MISKGTLQIYIRYQVNKVSIISGYLSNTVWNNKYL
jgi:hypothetical protein